MKKNKISLIFLVWLFISICTTFYAFAQTLAQRYDPEVNAGINLKIFDRVWDKINKHYFDPKYNGVNWKKMKKTYRPRAEQAESMHVLLAVIRQMMAELDNLHLSVRFVPDIKKEEVEREIGRSLKEGETWTFVPGFEFKAIEGVYVVTKVESGSPADRAGVKTGWIFTALDNRPLSVDAPVNIKWWEEGIESYRFKDLEDIDIDLSFAYEFLKITPELQVGWRSLEENIFYVRIRGFGPGVGDWVMDAMNNFQRVNAKAVIIDLRRNGGGLTNEAEKCLSSLFKEDVELGTFMPREGRPDKPKISGIGQKAFTGNVVVLTDEYTGSTSEIFCVVIREYKRGYMIGRKTLGTFTPFRQFNLFYDIELNVPVADYRTPKGVRLEGLGIIPDIEIDEPTLDDIRTGRDRALEKAMEFLSKPEMGKPQSN